MTSAPQLASIPARWRAQALAYHEICEQVARHIALDIPQKTAIDTAVMEHSGRIVRDDRGVEYPLPLSAPNLKRLFQKWNKAGRSYLVFVPAWRPGKQKIPRDLVADFLRRCTNKGMEYASVAIEALQREWHDGKEIPGLGTWRDWWSRYRAEEPLPPQPPEFPVHERTLYRYLPNKAAKAWGNRGAAEAKKNLPHPERDYAALRPAELLVFDDVRLDLLCVDDQTGKPTEARCYIAMDASCRLIPALTLRPANALVSYDVDALVVEALRVTGIGRDYATNLLFERGTLTMSRDAKHVIEQVSEGRIKVHYTSMNGGRSWNGAHPDAGTGNWMAKGVIESFMRKLHLLLMDAPGQRGSEFRRQPANLGWTGQGNNTKPGTLAHEAAILATIDLTFERRLRLNLGLMWLSQVNALLREAMKRHNEDHGHSYPDFGKITEQEIQPGVWQALPDQTEENDAQ